MMVCDESECREIEDVEAVQSGTRACGVPAGLFGAWGSTELIRRALRWRRARVGYGWPPVGRLFVGFSSPPAKDCSP